MNRSDPRFMKTRLLAPLWVVASMLAQSAGAAEGIPTGEQLTNKLRFKIPFTFEAEELARAGASEVQLLESRDQGTTWRRVQAVPPNEGRFTFQAPGSGSYWFSLRMIDRDGRQHPAGKPRPGLRVRVDADPPEVQLNLTQASPGTLHVDWEITDEQLEMNTFRLRYRQTGNQEWTRLSPLPQQRHQHDIRINQGGLVTVELTVSDAARNETRVQKSLQVEGPAGGTGVRRGERVAQSTRGMESGDPLRMATEFPDAGRLRAQARAAQPAQVAAAPVAEPRTPAEPVAMAARPVVGGPPAKIPAQLTSATPPTSGEPVSAPRERGPRLVNSLRFQVKYVLQSVAVEDIASVELYLTNDDGATWQLYGTDEDRRSPFLVEVPEPGEYGLQLIVRDKSGQGLPVPRDGTPPTQKVLVDQRAPELELLGATPQVVGGKLQFDITWKAGDEHPAEFPIGIAYAERPAGPWTTIASGLTNSGRHQWEPTGNLPAEIFLRVECRDAAGNLRIAETAKAIRTEQ
ncbi:MAG: hypothetical protein ACKOGA_24905 [Planctomycetaceae bacterium]